MRISNKFIVKHKKTKTDRDSLSFWATISVGDVLEISMEFGQSIMKSNQTKLTIVNMSDPKKQFFEHENTLKQLRNILENIEIEEFY